MEPCDANALPVPYPSLPEETAATGVCRDREVIVAKKKPRQLPKHSVVHRGEFSMQDFTNDRSSTLVKRPKELVVSVEFPEGITAGVLDVEMFDKRVIVQCSSLHYELDVSKIISVDPCNISF